ncbi:unnamed protein product [Lepidochelys olivacea]
MEMLGEPAAKKVAQVPLSNDTIAQRIHDLAHDMEDQLIGQIKLGKYFSLQLDECTDVANTAVLMVFVRFEHEGDLKEEFLFSASLPTKTTSSEVFKTVSVYIVNKCGLDFKFCVGVCSVGATAMTGWHSGVVTQIKALAPECKSVHCFLHRESLTTKKMSTELNSVLSEVVKILNHVKANALNSRLFAALCEIWELIINSSYCMLMYVGYRGEKSCQEYLSSETRLPSFFRTENQIGHNCSKMWLG